MSEATADAQTALDEVAVKSEELEKALEDREIARGAKSEATRKFKTLDDVVKAKLDELDLDEDETVRCGRFRITNKRVAGREVSFTTEPTMRLSITASDDD